MYNLNEIKIFGGKHWLDNVEKENTACDKISFAKCKFKSEDGAFCMLEEECSCRANHVLEKLSLELFLRNEF